MTTRLCSESANPSHVVRLQSNVSGIWIWIFELIHIPIQMSAGAYI